MQQRYTPDTFAALTSSLLKQHTLEIHPTNGKEVMIDGQKHPITIVPATETQTNGDMSQQVWIRDETLAARSIIEALKISPNRESESYKEQSSFKDTDFNAGTSFEEALDMMIDKGLRRIGEQLPHETPDYGLDSAKTTTADAALLYLLDYDVPKLLADKQIPIKAAGGVSMEREEIEDVILAEVGKLYDEETYGIRRYGATGDANKDTYLRGPYNTPGIQDEINRMKKELKDEAKGGSINLEKKMATGNCT